MFRTQIGVVREVVLADWNETNVERAREFFEQDGIADWSRFKVGDVHDVFEQLDGEFDIMLIDHDKEQYPDA